MVAERPRLPQSHRREGNFLWHFAIVCSGCFAWRYCLPARFLFLLPPRIPHHRRLPPQPHPPHPCRRLPGRPTRCRPISWPGPSPSAASATSSTLPVPSGASRLWVYCLPLARGPELKIGRSGSPSAGGSRESHFSLLTSSSRALPSFPSTGSASTMSAAMASACRAGAVGWAMSPNPSGSRSSSAFQFCCSSTGLCAAGRDATGSASGPSLCPSWFSPC